jgi:hypothetical protein
MLMYITQQLLLACQQQWQAYKSNIVKVHTILEVSHPWVSGFATSQFLLPKVYILQNKEIVSN